MILAGAGVLAAAAAATAAILLPPGRARAAAMLAALALCPVLILGDQWNTPQIADLRDESPALIALALAGLAAVVALLAAAFARWPVLLPLAIVATLPFRVPLEAGGDTANLLVPLYLMIAGGVVGMAYREWAFTSRAAGGGSPDDGRSAIAEQGEGSSGAAASRSEPARHPAESRDVDAGEEPSARRGPLSLLPLALAAVVLLYAAQTLYSPEFSKSLQNVCFFFAPFALVYALLREVRWDRRLLRLVLGVVLVEAVAFVLIGGVEYLSRSLFWNEAVIRSNEFHTYFRVNSVFWDPNIYGRYLALAIVVAMSALLWTRERRLLAMLTALVALLWVGLVPTFSQSSYAALLGGLAMLAAVRWSWRWTLGGAGVLAVFGIAVVIFAGGAPKLSLPRLNVDTGGRANLVTGGLELFGQRPVWGYGSGSFPRAYRERIAEREGAVSVSHTQPITVAAEQGLIGLFAYGALLVAALWTMAAGLFANGPPAGPPWRRVGRIAVLSAFVALLVHTMAYAGFFEDPIAWVLMAVAAALAAGPGTRSAFVQSLDSSDKARTRA